ncbi:uncharacterized protein KY384_007847 [Bacidia gigantensis]|uniref:uncharacterized protein n=1 Tax=Bacidia gigantensis TaxID=2732470 RepID=UPI001D05326A|nr:uncharacterized protein KY384_007847 [Bacidia gigantensis]KAG8527693.1 hypothetical protein KY384_007847 [Bacidia gigantensis]
MNSKGAHVGSLATQLRNALNLLLGNDACRGLIVQDALLSEAKLEKSRTLKWTRGLILLGCPFFKHESEWTKFGNAIAKLTKATQELDTVKLSQFGQISSHFASWAKTPAAKELSVWSFYERLPMYRMGTIVPQESAVIDINQSSPLPLDHLGLSKVDGPWDSHYQSICAKLREMSGTSNDYPEVPGIKRSESQDSREIVLKAFDRKDVVGRITRLALALEDEGHPVRAEEAYEQVIEKRKQIQRPGDEVQLFCEGRVSCILRGRGLYAQAEDQCRRVLDLKVQFTGPTSILTLQTAGDLALILRDQGNFEKAYNKIRDTLESEACSPYQDALHVRLVTILAAILKKLGYYDLSLFLTRKALSISVMRNGLDDPFTLELISEFSQILIEKGQHHFAEEVARRALDGFAKAYGADHPQSMKAATRLANTSRFLGQFDSAIEMFERTLKAQDLHLGPAHPDTVSTKCGLAATYALEMRLRDSEIMLQRVIDQQETIYGNDDHPDEIWTKEALRHVREAKQDLHQDSSCEIATEEPARRLDNFFRKPFRKNQGELQLFDGSAFSVENTNTVHSPDYKLRIAAMNNDLVQFRQMFDLSSRKTAVGGICGTALHAACFVGNVVMVEMLLDSGVNCNVQGGIFETPLRAASYNGHMHVVKVLLARGADASACGDFGGSPLQIALSMGHRELVQALLDAGADPNVTDHWYGTALHEASIAGEEDMVRILLEADAKPAKVTGVFGTALGAAAWNGNLNVVRILIQKGAMVDTQFQGRIALNLAAAAGHRDVMTELLKEAISPKAPFEPRNNSRSKGNSHPQLVVKDHQPTLPNKAPSPHKTKPTGGKQRKGLRKLVNILRPRSKKKKTTS